MVVEKKTLMYQCILVFAKKKTHSTGWNILIIDRICTIRLPHSAGDVERCISIHSKEMNKSMTSDIYEEKCIICI